MAVVGNAVEKYASRGGAESLSGDRTYTRIFLVKTDHTGDGAQQVRLAPGVPRVGQPYSTTREADGGVLCQRVQPNQIATFVWEVTCEYATQSGNSEGDPDRQNENPLLRPQDVAWSSATYSRDTYKDRIEKPILNSAGQPYDPPATVDQSRLVLTISRNEPEFDFERADAYADALNQDVFFNAPPGRAKMSTPRAVLQYANGVSYWRVTYEIHFHPWGWKLELIDAGTYYRAEESEVVSGGSSSLVDVPFSKQDAVGFIDLLDGNGGKLPQARKDIGDVVYNTFDVYESKDFSIFDLEPEA